MTIRRRFLFLSLGTLLLTTTTRGALIEHIVDPGVTLSAITHHPVNQHHLAYLEDSVPRLNKLMVFLPGTSSEPRDYSQFLQTAAALGYHAIALKYPNDVSVGSMCNAPPGIDPNCHSSVRNEILTGQDTTTLFEVLYQDSIKGRLLHFLHWLESNHPAEGWAQYRSGLQFQWPQITVCGHSQGGGHALFIAKEHEVDRCITFSGFDWFKTGGRPADWMNESFATPVDDLFFFVHLRDGAIDFETMSKVVVATLDITRYGTHVVVENDLDGSFNETHFLTSDLEPARPPAEGGLRHNVAILDDDLRFLPNGITPIMRPAWEYFLTHKTKKVRLVFKGDKMEVYFSPGILLTSTDFENWSSFPYPFTPSPLVVTINSQAWSPRAFYSLLPAP